MAHLATAFDNWKDWAKTDWKEFSVFFVRKHGVEAFNKAQAEFASQMKVSTHFLGQLTDFATGKLAERASGTLAGALSIGDILAKLAGLGYVSAYNEIQGRTRDNPIKLIQTYVFSDEYGFNEGQLKDYVQFILYWYPKDIQAGFYGFRYGDGQNPLRIKKEISVGYYGR